MENVGTNTDSKHALPIIAFKLKQENGVKIKVSILDLVFLIRFVWFNFRLVTQFITL